jgi:hypothetical protein
LGEKISSPVRPFFSNPILAGSAANTSGFLLLPFPIMSNYSFF